ncbi:hypothetical protein BXZ70DRAFT_506567 [Cristinia sonorae]|uniref:Uncharacterized protein n=1 Tax=Cristinia sonorae TaxID=1940300 RepID=A0A8K0UV75_9AGAR|nr:hypothetical protein BXZ70DRAFT_506567 [Cristinia sonorae]
MTSYFKSTSSAALSHDDDWIDDLKEKTEGKISDESRKNANKALEEASKKSLSESIKEIQALVKEGNDLDTRLFDIARLAEKAKLSSKAEAKEIRDRFIDLLWNSRSIASTAQGAADDFRGDMLELILMDDISADEKKAALIEYITTVQGKGQAAAAQPGRFKDFTEKLRDYANRVEKEIGDEENEAKAKLDKLKADLEEVTVELHSLTVNVVGPIVKYLKLAGGAFAGVLSGSPAVAFAAIFKAVKEGIPELQQFSANLEATQAKRKVLIAKQDKINTSIRELEGQQVLLGDASTIPSSLRSISEGITNFAGRMTTFTDSFSQVEAEAEQFRKFIEDGVAVSDPVFQSAVGLVKELFRLNSAILKTYASASV